LRWILETSLYSKKVQDAITADLKPEDQKVWARHILVADEATAQSIITRLKNGADFAVLAKLYSTDTSNNSNGGDLGWFTKGAMDATFEKTAFAMKVGEISQPVQTQFGWHIIQCLGNQLMPLTGTEFTQYQQRTFTNWLTQTRTDRKDIKKYDIWSQRVPTDPVFTPQPVATP
jgi:foldase protein PrsA